MAAIVSSETKATEVRQNGITRYRFRYVVDTGETRERIAWVPSATDEATERTFRGNLLLQELADAEFNQMLST